MAIHTVVREAIIPQRVDQHPFELRKERWCGGVSGGGGGVFGAVGVIGMVMAMTKMIMVLVITSAFDDDGARTCAIIQPLLSCL